MNIEEIKMDHFENFEELIKTCKMWIRDDDIEAYYRFFEFNCMKTLVTAYEKEKEKNKELEESNQEKAKMLTEQNRNLQISYDSLQELFELRKYKNSSIPVSLVEETIEELNKLITEAQKELGSASKEYTIYVYQKDILQKLLEKRK